MMKATATKAKAVPVSTSKSMSMKSSMTKSPLTKSPLNKPVNKSVSKPIIVSKIAPAPKPANKSVASSFRAGDFVVYPAHGVGKIDAIETQSIGGMSVSLYTITFEKDRMRLKVPVMKAESSGLRKLVSVDRLKDAIKTLKGRARIRRTMWSRRAQEYELKINSGDPIAIAEVLRDLKRAVDDTEQSYSERQIYQSALERLARELAAVQKITESQAAEQIEQIMRGERKRLAA